MLHKFKWQGYESFKCFCQRAVTTIKNQRACRALNKIGWTCSYSWITQFKRTHNIVFMSVCSESHAVIDKSVDDWRSTMLMRQISSGQFPLKIFAYIFIKKKQPKKQNKIWFSCETFQLIKQNKKLDFLVQVKRS